MRSRKHWWPKIDPFADSDLYETLDVHGKGPPPESVL